jgi:hypothetical protein
MGRTRRPQEARGAYVDPSRVNVKPLAGTGPYCQIEPGVVTIIQGVQQIIDVYVSGTAKTSIDAAFALLVLALQAPCASSAPAPHGR